MKKTLLCVLIGVVAGCSTVSNPFVHMAPDFSDLPVDAMRQTALEIEQAVADGNRTPAIADREGIVVNDQTVLQTIRTRAARSTLINILRDTGYVCEKKNGLLYILGGKEYDKSRNRRQRDRDAYLVMSENEDRWRLYEGLAKTSNLSSRSVSAIQEIFFNARVQCLPEGQKYESADGQCVVKGAE